MPTNPFLVKDSIAATVATSTTWLDSSDNSLDLTATNSPTLDTLGDAGSEYNPFWTLDGVDQNFEKADDADLDFGTGDFSLEIVFYAPTLNSGRLIAKRNANVGYEFYIENTTDLSILIGDTSANLVFGKIGDTALTAGEWFHYIVTFDRSSDATIYRNSVADGTTDISSVVDTIDNAESFNVGSSSDGASNTLSCNIAIVRSWNRILSQSEIDTQYNGGDFWKVQAPAVDQWGSSDERITASKDRNFTGGATNWANTGGLSAFDETGDLTIVADGTSQFCILPLTSFTGGFVVGESYRIFYDHTERTGGWRFQLAQTGDDLVLGAAVAGTQNYLDFTPTATVEASGLLIVSTTANADGDFDNFSVIRTGAVAEYRLVHTNSFSPFEFEKARFLPVSEPRVPRQISGVAGGGQIKIASLGDDLENFPFRINRVSATNKDNFEGFIQDDTVDFGLNTFTFVEEDATENTVRWLIPGSEWQLLWATLSARTR